MSGLDQPLLIANSNYHVGQQTSIRVAEEQGYFQEEGLAEWVYEPRGLIPGPLEREGLGLVMDERGVDIATAVDVASVVHQRSMGAELYVVGGWRYPPNFKVFGAKGMVEPAQLRGKRIGLREPGSLGQHFVVNQLRKLGIDGYAEVEWVFDRVFSYGNDPAHLDWLREGRVDALTSQPPFTALLEDEGFPVLLDPLQIYPGGRPDKVIVATGRVIQERPDELEAFLRANIRGFWFMRDGDNLAYLQDLEGRLRAASHNEDERQIRMLTGVEKLEGWTVPVHGGVSYAAFEQVIGELLLLGELERPITVEEVLREFPVHVAYLELTARPELEAAHAKALAAVEKYGF